ncbi:hypothetical protein [Neorhizobium petrolearium]|uniref:hypothetical protein n=1 Tax=Neorhizobium petrolearium TaxID=515361 RepID=UPI003F82356F
MNALLRLAEVGVKLPLKVSPDDVGVVLDADGFDVITIDVNGIRSDDQANAIASLIVELINASHWMRPGIEGTHVYVPHTRDVAAFEKERKRIADQMMQDVIPRIKADVGRLRDPLDYFERREAERKEYLNRRAAQRLQSDPSPHQECSRCIPDSDSGSAE